MSDTWDYQVTLIGHTYKENEYGQQIPETKGTTVFCNRKPVPRGEFYAAAQADIEIAELLVIHPYEYSGEKQVEFQGQIMTITRTYPKDSEELELSCEVKGADA